MGDFFRGAWDWLKGNVRVSVGSSGTYNSGGTWVPPTDLGGGGSIFPSNAGNTNTLLILGVVALVAVLLLKK